MPHNITELDVFTTPIVVPDGTDNHMLLSSYMAAFVQALANRTKYLSLHGGKLASINWTLRDAGGYTDDFQGIVCGRDTGDNSRVWVAVGPDKIMRSVDHGKTWASVSTAAEDFHGVAYGNGMFVAVGGTGATPALCDSCSALANSAAVLRAPPAIRTSSEVMPCLANNLSS